MIIAKRFAFALALTFFVALACARAQTPQVSTVNVAPETDKIRVAAIGDVLDMRVAVSDEAGDIVFESGPVTGNNLDWAMRSEEGARVPAGTYTMTVTYRTSSGKLRRRVEQVLVTEEGGKAEAQAAAPSPAAAVGPITGAGTVNKVAKFTGANSIGDSAITETGGRVGFGTPSPQQSLHAVGASSRLRLQSTNGTALTTTEYVTNGRVWQSGAGGSTAANGVANKFFVFDQTANQFRLVLDAAGNFGVGTTAPTSKLTVNGQLQILGAGNGIKFADGSIQTKAIAGTINGTGTANHLAKFTGANSFGNSTVTEVSGRVGIGTASPVVNLQVQGSGIAEAQVRSTSERAVLSLDSTIGGASRVWTMESGLLGNQGLFGIYDRTAGRAGLVINSSGNVGIGTTTPSVRLHVVAEPGGFAAVFGSNDVQNGVYGKSTDGNGVYGVSTNGNAGRFDGPVQVNGALTATGNVCAANISCASDARLKQNVTNLKYGLDQLLRLRPVSWRWKSEPEGKPQMGLVAQEVENVIPELVLKDADATKPLALNYMALLPVAVKAIQEQQAQIREQSRQIERLRAQLDQVKRAMLKRRAANRGR
jgi:hypothetical protein